MNIEKLHFNLILKLKIEKLKEFLQKAEDIAKLFLPVFDSPTGIPYSLFNPGT